MTDELDLLSAATAAVRATGEAEPGPLADATRARLRQSLAVRAHHHHRTVRVGAVLAVLLATSASWAWSTGRLARVLAPFRHGAVEAPLAPPAPPAEPVERAYLAAAPARAWTPAPHELAPPVAPPVAPAVAPDVPPAPVGQAPVRAPQRSHAAIERLYRHAHELHFHGSDHAAALAAWDAYLAAEPTGRFAVEARYNRALVLVRLHRYAEARDALAPFARGELAPYRQRQATELVERLDALRANEQVP